MPETLEGMLQQAGPAAPSAPASEPAPSGTGGAAPSTTPESPAPAGQPPADELPGSLREYLAANPGHKEIVDHVNREMQKAWTPKLQEAADLRKQLDGIAPTDLQTLRQIQEAARINPQVVRDMLINYANTLAPPAPAAPAQNPFGDLQPSTPAERFAVEKVMEIEEWRQQREQQEARERVQQFAQHATAEFGRLAGEYQITIPVDAQILAAKLAQANNISIEQALWATNQKAMSEALVRKARDEASSVVADKAAASAGNPGALVPRSAPSDPNGKRDFKSIFAQTKEEMGIT